MKHSQSTTSVLLNLQHLQKLLCAACPYALSSSGSLIIHRTSQNHWGSVLVVEESLAMLICQCVLATPIQRFVSLFMALSKEFSRLCGKLSCFTLAMTSLNFLPGGYHKNGTLNLVFSATIYIRHMILRKTHGKQANRHLISVKRSFCLRGSKSLQYRLAQINTVYFTSQNA